MLRIGCQHVADILEQTADSNDASTMGQGAMRSVFWSTWQIYGCGDGWRPDLLVHPCQSWLWSREESFDREKDLGERLSVGRIAGGGTFGEQICSAGDNV